MAGEHGSVRPARFSCVKPVFGGVVAANAPDAVWGDGALAEAKARLVMEEAEARLAGEGCSSIVDDGLAAASAAAGTGGAVCDNADGRVAGGVQ
jgi:hypothetical protein